MARRARTAQPDACRLDDACRRIDATMAFASPSALANVVATAEADMLDALVAARERVQRCDPVRQVGRVTGLVGMTIEVRGLSAPVGSLCRIEAGRHRDPVICEAVGFQAGRLVLMPYGPMPGIAPGQAVVKLSPNQSFQRANCCQPEPGQRIVGVLLPPVDPDPLIEG